MEIIYTPEKRKIVERLNEQFGITELPYLLLRFGREKIRMYTGSLSSDEMKKINNELRVEVIGLYFLHEYPEGLRPSIDAIHLLKDQIKKGFVEVNEEQALDWFKGRDVKVEGVEKGFVILKFNGDFIGCGKSTKTEIKNYLPKERRIRN